MAYVSKQVIDAARKAIKTLNNEYNIKATISGVNSSSLKLTISQGSIDFIGNYIDTNKNVAGDEDYIRKNSNVQVNHYWLDKQFSGEALEYLEKAKKILIADHWDQSDVQTDYFYCSFYINIDIGRWDKPYVFTV